MNTNCKHLGSENILEKMFLRIEYTKLYTKIDDTTQQRVTEWLFKYDTQLNRNFSLLFCFVYLGLTKLMIYKVYKWFQLETFDFSILRRYFTCYFF